MGEKRIEVLKMKVGDLEAQFWKSTKNYKEKAEELGTVHGHVWGLRHFLVDEHDNVIAGNQRSIILARRDPDRGRCETSDRIYRSRTSIHQYY